MSSIDNPSRNKRLLSKRRALLAGAVVATGGFAGFARRAEGAPGDETIRSRFPSPISLRRVVQIPVRRPQTWAWSQDARRLAVIIGEGEEVVVFDTSTWTAISRFERPGAIGYRTLAFLPNSQIVTFADQNDVNSSWLLGIYDGETGRLVRRVPRKPGNQFGRMQEVAVTSDGKYIVVLTDEVRSSIPIYDSASLENIGWMPLPTNARARMLAPGPGSKLAFGVFIIGLPGARKNIHVYDIGARTAGLIIPAHIPNIESIAWSPTGRLIASGASGLVGDGKGWFRDVDPLRVWDSANGSLIRSYEGFLDSVHQITWHPAGNVFATTGRKDETEYGSALRLWSPSKSSALFEYRPPGTTGVAASFHPGTGQLLLSGQGTLQVYDVEGL